MEITDIINQEIDHFVIEYGQMPDSIEMSTEDWMEVIKFYFPTARRKNVEINIGSQKQYFRGIEIILNDFIEGERFVLYK